MAKFPFDIIGFDLDGTLLDTSGDIANATNHALATIGRGPLPKEQIRTMIGGGVGMTLHRALAITGGEEPEIFATLNRISLDHYGAHIHDETHAFPGLIAALDQLDALGVHYGVATNKLERHSVKVLRALDLYERMHCIIGRDTLGEENAKPSPAMIHELIARAGGGRAAFIGDSDFDTRAARAAGIPSIACSFGFLDGPVEHLGADAVIDHFDALIPTLVQLGSNAWAQ